MKSIIYSLLFTLLLAACDDKDNVTPKADLQLAANTSHCGEFVVYKFGTYKDSSITFELRNYANQLDTTTKSLKIIALAKNDCCEPSVIVTTYKNYPPFSFCPGIVPANYQPEPELIWQSESGELQMQVKEKLPSAPTAFPILKVDFRFKNIVLKNQKGEIITIPDLLLENTLIGGPIPG